MLDYMRYWNKLSESTKVDIGIFSIIKFLNPRGRDFTSVLAGTNRNSWWVKCEGCYNKDTYFSIGGSWVVHPVDYEIVKSTPIAKLKYNVGDFVSIKNIPNTFFDEEQSKYCGRIAVITEVAFCEAVDMYFYKLDIETNHIWNPVHFQTDESNINHKQLIVGALVLTSDNKKWYVSETENGLSGNNLTEILDFSDYNDDLTHPSKPEVIGVASFTGAKCFNDNNIMFLKFKGGVKNA